MTIQQLYDYAKERHIENARLRICDGMAVSFYPTISSLSRATYEVVLDVSDLTPIEFDDLDIWSRRQF
ncbi:MAG: hypothetical protein RRZ83_00380 [Alistipes sp.]